jgi:phosphatidate cytidylyltransferase
MKLAIIGSDMDWRTPLLGRSGCYLVFYAVFVAKFTDVGAFFVGRSLGRHKLAPKLSPSKTWEGAIGGIVVGTITSILFLLVVLFQLGDVHVSMHHGIILGLLLSLAAIAGDLVESMLKRAVAVKDSATSVPGLGGMLDIFDSMLFAIPVFYIYAKAFLF